LKGQLAMIASMRTTTSLAESVTYVTLCNRVVTPAVQRNRECQKTSLSTACNISVLQNSKGPFKT
jgi:hypothetical protein